MKGDQAMNNYMTIISKISVILNFCMILSYSATIIVNTKSINSNDTNPGTITHPLKTINGAIKKAKSGDSIAVYPGKYEEDVIVNISSVNQINKYTTKIYTVKNNDNDTVSVTSLEINCANIIVSGFFVDGKEKKIGVTIKNDNITIENNTIVNSIQGVRVEKSKPYHKHLVIKNNFIYRSQYGIICYADSSEFVNNKIQRLYRYSMEGGDCDYTRFFGKNLLISNNQLYGTDKDEVPGAHVDCFQFFSNNGEYLQNVIIENNLCSECDQGIMASNVGNTDNRNILIRNNIFHSNIWAWGVVMFGIKDVKIVNNLFQGTVGLRDGSTGIIKNNIFYYDMYKCLYDTPDSVPFKNNFIAKTSSNPVSSDFKKKYNDNIYDLDPQFIDYKNKIFIPKDSSPLINKGAALPDLVPNDIIGSPRPVNGSWDIGAYEVSINTPIKKINKDMLQKEIISTYKYNTKVIKINLQGRVLNSIGISSGSYLLYNKDLKRVYKKIILID